MTISDVLPTGSMVWFRGYRYRVTSATEAGGLVFYHLLADDPASPDVRGPVPAAQVSPVASNMMEMAFQPLTLTPSAYDLRIDARPRNLHYDRLRSAWDDEGASADLMTVTAREVHIPHGFEADVDDLALWRDRLTGPEQAYWLPKLQWYQSSVCVLQRSDETLWVYDPLEVAYISVLQELDPNISLRVAVLGRDGMLRPL